jgi:hypothetical protein
MNFYLDSKLKYLKNIRAKNPKTNNYEDRIQRHGYDQSD